MKNMLTKKKFWIPVLLILVIAIGGYYAYTTYWQPTTEVEEETSAQTAVARMGNMEIFTSAAGVVVAAKEIGVGFDESGTLSELMVNVGDKVENGQVIARSQTNNSEESIAAAIASAELSVLKAQQELDDIHDSWPMDAAQALLAVEEAEQALVDIQNPELQQTQAQLAILEAQNNLDDAEQTLASMDYQRCSDEIIDAYAEDYDKALASYERRPSANTLQAVNTALANLNWCSMNWTEEEIAEADANLELAAAELKEAELAYDRVKDGPSPGELAVLDAQLATAQQKWERIKDAPDPDEIAMAEAQLFSAETQLNLAQDEQVYIELVSPMDGTVLSIDATEGEKVGTSPIITVADLDQPLLEIYLDETDLDMVGIGFEVEVIFDALPDETFTGHVIEVNPSLQNISNVSTVLALVQLDVDSFAKPQTLPLGLNATVDVIGGRVENAVLIPVEALRELGSDEYAVFVMENDEPRLRVVNVGLVDFTTAEVIFGLDAGEIVTTGLVETE
jgi:multidrug efflux pump subunit AcrA (membrane-fusion protein)